MLRQGRSADSGALGVAYNAQLDEHTDNLPVAINGKTYTLQFPGSLDDKSGSDGKGKSMAKMGELHKRTLLRWLQECKRSWAKRIEPKDVKQMG
jgi:hypothetical protein